MGVSDAVSSDLAVGKPRTRQRVYKVPPALDVPDIEQNAAERKRVLNVLAQRRYRARKREMRQQGNGTSTQKRPSRDNDQPAEQSTPEICSPLENGSSTASDTGSQGGSIEDSVGGVRLDSDLDMSNMDLLDPAILDPLLETSAPEMLPYIPDDENTMQSGAPCPPEVTTDLWGFTGGTGSAAASSSDEDLSTSPVSTGTEFLDSYLLPVHELATLRALIRIAERLGCTGEVWSLDAVSPFSGGKLPGPEQPPLPELWRPTALQMMVPHHPILDVLPWPRARNMMINMLSLPDSARPPHAAGPLALVNFAYDLEDGAEGIRIYGGDPFDGSCWEIGQVLFERWWFLFDRETVDNSNRWRRLRGAPPLLLKGA